MAELVAARSEAAPAGRADRSIAALTGAAAVSFSALYFASDVVELVQGGFSTFQLLLTYLAEAAIPLFVLGLYAEQRREMGSLGLIASVAYAYTFVFFTGTVSYALVDRTADWEALQQAWGAWLTLHSVLMVVAGIGLGVAVVRARVLPRWTGVALVLGMVSMAAAVGAPEVVQTVAAGVRDLAFAAMGMALLRDARTGSSRRVDAEADLELT